MIPDKPLSLTFDLDELTIDELALFESESPFRPSVFKAFLKRYGNWSAAELGRIQRKDIAAIYLQCIRQLNEALVPKATGGA